MTADPFSTGRLRDAALATWTAQPSRFREDANAEEDHGRGYYRDRVVIELAQNAADAAARAGVGGRLLLRLLGPEADGTGTLVAANTGAPLDPHGVASLASLRASAKRADTDGTQRSATIGRFGVGFAAVRSVSDELTVASTTGSVHFSLNRTAELLATVTEPSGLAIEVEPSGLARDAEPSGLAADAEPSGLAIEVERRRASLPILRVPFEGPAPGGPDVAGLLDEGWDTAVVLTLRDPGAVAEVRRQLSVFDDRLLLALPALHRVDVHDGAMRTVADVADRWVVATRTGLLPPELLADRPVEERERRGWQITWAVRRPGADDGSTVSTGVASSAAGTPSPGGAMPLPSGGMPSSTVHAPTPTDEPSTLPAVLVGTFPLDPSRRHVAPGPLTDALVAEAGATWGDLLAACRDARSDEHADAPHPLDLLPAGLPAGTLDAALRSAAFTVARTVPLLVPVDGGPPVAPPDAVVLTDPLGQDATVLRALSRWLPNLVRVDPRHRHLVTALGMHRTELSDVVDALPHTDPAGHREVYDAFATVDGVTLEQLATLPVPLADGRTVRGARGLVLLDPSLDEAVVEVLASWGVRAVHPDASHPLLERLGATAVDAAGLLRHPVLRHHVLEVGSGADDDASADQVSGVFLSLVEAALERGAPLDPEPWWAELLLPAADGELLPARGLVVPGSDAARWFDPEVLAPLHPDVVDRWGHVVAVVGVRTGLAVVRVDADRWDETSDDAARPGQEPDDTELVTQGLDGWTDYLDEVGTDLPEVTVVADLDAVRPDAWPEVLRAMAAGPARHALVERTRVPGRTFPSYTAWWLRRRSGLGLERPFALSDPDAVRDFDAVGERGAAGESDALGEPDVRTDGGVTGLLAAAPDVVRGLDDEVLRSLGGLDDPRHLDPDGWADLLDALPPAGQEVSAALAVDVWRGLAGLVARSVDAEVDVARLPALTGRGTLEIVSADDVAVAGPMWAQHPDVRPLLVVPSALLLPVAEALDLEPAPERMPGEVTSQGHPALMPPAVRAVLGDAPSSWVEHDDLRVDGRQVDWWVTGRGVPHAATTSGLAHAVAHLISWPLRDTVERLLVDPSAVTRVALDRAGDLEPADDDPRYPIDATDPTDRTDATDRTGAGR